MTTIVHKKLLFTVTFFFIVFTSKAQWTSVSPLTLGGGAIGNDGAVSFTIKGKGYIVAGSSTNKIYAYDTSSNKWSFVDSIPKNVGRAFAMSFVINDKAYIVGGDISGVPTSTVWEFNPAKPGSTMWSQKNDFPAGVRDGGFGFTLNNFGYVGAGNDNTNLYNDIWKYNPVNDTWSVLPASLPISGLIFPSTFVIGNKGYILTGGTAPLGVNEVKDMWCIDGSNDSLTAKAPLKGFGRQAAFAFSNGAFGFIGGGQANYTTNYNDMWMYDAANDQWTLAPRAPLFGAAWSSAFVIGHNAYVGLGAKFSGTGLTGDLNFYKFNVYKYTGINQINDNKTSISIYPNPASEYLTIIAPTSEKLLMEMYSSSGEKVMSCPIMNNDRIPLRQLSTGMYCVRIISGNNAVFNTKVLITN